MTYLKRTVKKVQNMTYFVIDGDRQPTLSKEMLDIELNDIALDTVLYLIVASQVAYIQYYGFFPVKVCKQLIKQTLKRYNISPKYYKEIEEDVFRILKTTHDVKQCKQNVGQSGLSLLEEMKSIQFKI